MSLVPVLTMIRASGIGLAFGMATLLIGSCSARPNESDALRIKRVEEAVLPMARIALEAEQMGTAKRLYLRPLVAGGLNGLVEAPIPKAHPARDTGEREEQPADDHAGSDGRQMDRSDLRPFAIKVGGEYFVRIGVYAIESAAQDLASELRRVTTELVDVTEFGMGNGSNAVRLYRVLIGPIASRASLIELVETLEGMGSGAARVPPSGASGSEPAGALEPAPSSEQSKAGPELVEVFVESVGNNTDATPTRAQQVQAVLQPAPGGENSVATSGVAGEMPSAEDIDPETSAEHAGSSPSVGDNRAASLSGNGREDPEDAPQFLQVGAFAVRSSAEALAAEVGSVARASVRIVEAELANGETIHRVQVGPIGSRRMMTEFSRMLSSRGYGTVRVLPESPATDSATGSAGEVPPRQPLPSGSPQRRVKAFIVHEDGRRFLQMGAYAVRLAADALASELRGQIDTEVRITEVLRGSGDSMYRVRIGPIPSDDSLVALVEAVESLGFVVD